MGRSIDLKALQEKVSGLPALNKKQATEAQFRIRQTKEAEEATIPDVQDASSTR